MARYKFYWPDDYEEETKTTTQTQPKTFHDPAIEEAWSQQMYGDTVHPTTGYRDNRTGVTAIEGKNSGSRKRDWNA